MKILVPLLALAAVVAGCSKSPAAPVVEVTGAWCRQPPPGAPAQGCYVTLKSSTDDRLIAVETPDATRAEIHEMSMAGDVMRMRRLEDGLPLPAGESVAMAPGGLHLMLIGPKPGAAPSLTLRFQHAPAVAVAATVGAAPHAAGAHH